MEKDRQKMRRIRIRVGGLKKKEKREKKDGYTYRKEPTWIFSFHST